MAKIRLSARPQRHLSLTVRVTAANTPADQPNGTGSAQLTIAPFWLVLPTSDSPRGYDDILQSEKKIYAFSR